MFYQFRQFWSFYRSAVTRYQLHSPLAFEVVQVLTDDDRWFYVFEDAERIRHKMLASKVEIAITDYGAGSAGRGAGQRKSTVAAIASRAGSSPAQGRKLFRLAQWVAPKTMLELGTSLGLGTLYLAAASRTAQFISLEGCPACAGVARTNLEIAGLTHAIVRAGEFGITLDKALQDLGEVDLVYLDGNHQKEPTLLYFEKCLRYAHENTVFVLDDVHWSPDMTEAWEAIKNHPKVTLTLDFFDLSLVFIRPNLREKQHFCVVPYYWKPWKFM